MTHFIITKETKRQPYIFVEAIFLGFHIRYGNGGLHIISQHTEEDKEFIYNRLSGSPPFPVCHYDNWVKNLVMLINRDPDAKIIQANSFEYAAGVYPDNF